MLYWKWGLKTNVLKIREGGVEWGIIVGNFMKALSGRKLVGGVGG